MGKQLCLPRPFNGSEIDDSIKTLAAADSRADVGTYLDLQAQRVQMCGFFSFLLPLLR